MRCFTHFLPYVRCIVQVYLLVQNDQLCIYIGPYLPIKGAKVLPYYTLKCGCSSLANTVLSFLLLIWTIWNPIEGTGRAPLACPISSEGVTCIYIIHWLLYQIRLHVGAKWSVNNWILIKKTISATAIYNRIERGNHDFILKFISDNYLYKTSSLFFTLY